MIDLVNRCEGRKLRRPLESKVKAFGFYDAPRGPRIGWFERVDTQEFEFDLFTTCIRSRKDPSDIRLERAGCEGSDGICLRLNWEIKKRVDGSSYLGLLFLGNDSSGAKGNTS